VFPCKSPYPNHSLPPHKYDVNRLIVNDIEMNFRLINGFSSIEIERLSQDKDRFSVHFHKMMVG